MFFVLAIGISILVSACADPGAEKVAATLPSIEDEKSDREFLLGIVPSPRTVPESSFDDLIDAYQEAGNLADVAMIWGSPGGIGLYDRLVQNQVVTAVRVYGLKPFLTLNFHTITEISGQGLSLVVDAPQGVVPDVNDPVFRQMWVREAKRIAREFQPEYLSLGNEINDYFHFKPADLDPYLSLFEETYQEIKQVSPETKVLVVFSYNHLLDNQQWDLLEMFSDRADIIGLTTYPWAHFDSPQEIEEDYYSRLNQYLDIPIAFTEIGWPSYKNEQEQAEFLARFVELTRENEIEMINWLFLHEMDVSEGIGKSVFSPETGTIALKKADGTQKLIYYMWEKLVRGELK